MENLQNNSELNSSSNELNELGVEWAKEVWLEWANAAIEEFKKQFGDIEFTCDKKAGND